jgi:uroporphyrinogen decarboxylase
MGIGPKYIGPNLKKEDDYFVNEWGLGYSRQDYEAGEYYEKTVIPLSDADTIEDLKAYQWPDPDWYDFNTI